MEDIPRDVQKELDSYKVAKSTGKGGHWTLLFVGERGEVVTIRKFKGLMFLAIFIMVVSISVVASVYMLYKKPFGENRRLKAALSMAENRVSTLGEERELLLTRLGIAESRIKKIVKKQPAPKQPDKVVSAKPVAGGGAQTLQEETKPVREIKEARPDLSLPEKPETPETDEIASEVKPEIKVDIRDLKVQHDPELNLLNVQFRLKNINLEAGAVSGRTFVVLETDQDDGENSLTFPKVTLVDGKPAQIHLGRYFSISRFNIVKFKSVYEQDPKPFNSATVFVYSGTGDLLLEKRFLIENPFEKPGTDPSESEENQTEETGETDGDPEEDELNNTILNN